MNFPTMAGLNARTFTEGERQGARPRHAPGLQRLGPSTSGAPPTRAGSSRWASCRCGTSTSPSRRSTGSARRAAGRSASSRPRTCRATRASCRATGTRCSRRSCDENMVLSLHIGAGFDVIKRPAEAPIDHLMVLACQISAITAQDLLFGPTLRQFPDLQGRAVRGRHRLDPVLLRPHRPPLREPGVARTAATTSAASCRPRSSASTSSPATSPTRRASCCATASASTTSPGSATTRTPTPRGRRRPSSAWKEFQEAGVHRRRRSTRSPGRTPAGSSTGTRSSTRRRSRRHRRRAPGPGHRRRHHPHVQGRVEDAATRPPASASSTRRRRRGRGG